MKKIREDIRSGEYERCYLLFGEETYLVADYKHRLLKALVQPGDTLNFARFSGETVNWAELIDLAETMPFLAEHRVILVEDSGFFAMSSEKIPELVAYIEGIPESTILVFCESEVDKRGRLYKAVSKHGYALEIKRQSRDDLTRWMLGKLKAENKNITKSALNEFFERLGTDMGLLAQEMEKLICYCLDQDVIDLDDVKNICTRSLEDQIFDMVDCICEFKREQALAYYFDLVRLDVAPEKIMALLMRHYRILMELKSLERSSVPQSDYAARLKVPPFALRKYQAQTKQLSMERITGILDQSSELVYQSRRSVLDVRIATELLIFYASDGQKDGERVNFGENR